MHDADFDRALAPGVHAGESAGERRASAVAMPQRHYFKVPGVHARHLDRGFVGLGAAVGEVRFLQRARRDLRQLLRQVDHRLIGKAGRNVLHAIDLRLGSRDHARIAVADADGDDAAEKVEILFALHIPHVLHERVIHGKRIGVVGRDRRKDVFLLLAIDFFAAQTQFLSGNKSSAHAGPQAERLVGIDESYRDPPS